MKPLLRPLLLLPAALLILAACSSAPTPEKATDSPNIVPRGLSSEPYTGEFAGYRPLDEAVAGLEPAIGEARRRMELRLGIAPDPERPRLLRFADDVETWTSETRIIGGRSVQVIVLPAAPLAQGRETIDELLLEALTHAVLDDEEYRGLPRWLRGGAPLWISGRMERALAKRVLSSEASSVSEDAVLPGFDPLASNSDSLSGSFFLAWLAEAFGSEVLPDLVRALTSAETIEEGLAAVLPHDPSSLEAGFDTYRVMRVDQLAEDPTVVELRAVRSLPPAERVVRLSGLSPRAPNPVIGAAVEEELGLAQYQAGDYAGASATLARVERDYVRDALHPGRDSFLFAMSFLKRNQPSAAAMRFQTFVQEFPANPDAPQALFELASILLQLDRGADATARFRELSERFPESPYARRAWLELGAFERDRHRYALARSYLERALPDEEARRALAELDAALAGGLPAEAIPAVRQALRDLASPDEATGAVGVAALEEIGPIAEPLVLQAAENPSNRWFDSRVILGVKSWGLTAATPVLAALLAKSERSVVEDAFAALSEMGATAGRIREILDRLPANSTVAENVWQERFGGKTGIPEVAGLIADQDFEQRIQAARILGGITDPGAVTALRALLDDPSPPVRRAAANALGNHQLPAARTALRHALDDASVTVRVEAIGSLARILEFDPIRERGLKDEAAAVRVAAATELISVADQRVYVLLVGLLADPEAGVASRVEALLRDQRGPAYEGALVDGLISAPEEGTAMRIVRLMCRRVDRDLGYDPGGGERERERIAALFVSIVEGS